MLLTAMVSWPFRGIIFFIIYQKVLHEDLFAGSHSPKRNLWKLCGTKTMCEWGKFSSLFSLKSYFFVGNFKNFLRMEHAMTWKYKVWFIGRLDQKVNVLLLRFPTGQLNTCMKLGILFYWVDVMGPLTIDVPPVWFGQKNIFKNVRFSDTIYFGDFYELI